MRLNLEIYKVYAFVHDRRTAAAAILQCVSLKTTRRRRRRRRHVDSREINTLLQPTLSATSAIHIGVVIIENAVGSVTMRGRSVQEPHYCARRCCMSSATAIVGLSWTDTSRTGALCRLFINRDQCSIYRNCRLISLRHVQ